MEGMKMEKSAQPKETLVKSCYFNGPSFTGSVNKKMTERKSSVQSKVFSIFG